MKNLNLNFTITLTAAILFFSASSCSAVRQSKDEFPESKFLILVETTDEGIKLSCEKGCAWKDLSFTLKPFQPQDIDQYGMSSLGEQNTTTKKNLADFHFTIKKTSDGIRLEGMNGTTWENLSFNCASTGCHQYIDQSGMISKD